VLDDLGARKVIGWQERKVEQKGINFSLDKRAVLVYTMRKVDKRNRDSQKGIQTVWCGSSRFFLAWTTSDNLYYDASFGAEFGRERCTLKPMPQGGTRYCTFGVNVIVPLYDVKSTSFLPFIMPFLWWCNIIFLRGSRGVNHETAYADQGASSTMPAMYGQ